MATLTIGDKSVEVGDEFLRMSRADQESAVAEIAKSIGATAPKEEKASPVTANDVVRATATGVPVVGGVLNKLNAATNAALAPVVEPFLTPSENDISRDGAGFAERFRRSEAIQNLADKRFAEEHPIVDTAAKITGGVAGTIPAMMAAPAAFGLTGTLPQMVARGAASNAALGAADAAVRGEDVVVPAAVGGVVGAVAPLVAKGVGAGVRKYQEMRNPAAPVADPANIERVAGVDINMHQTADPAIEAEKELARRGARGGAAEAVARQADDEARAAIGQAEGNIAASLDPTATAAATKPTAAADIVQQELSAAAAARQAAEAQQARQVAAEGQALSRDLSGGAAPVTPFDAAGNTGAAVTAARDAALARRKAAYAARDAVEGTFDESVPQGLAEDIRGRLNTGPAEERVWVDPVNESAANRALKLIDQTVGKDSGLFNNRVAPKAPEPIAPAKGAAKPKGEPLADVVDDETTAELRKKFGDTVADAYKKQQKPAPAQDTPLSLMQFIASKGGLAPDPELNAIGLAAGHREQIPGQKGFFGAVRKNGADIDRMREAAEEAGYLRGQHGETSTPAQFLDAIEAELRGKKVYPEGHAGHVDKKAAQAARAGEQAEFDRVMAGHEADLREAGHGEVSPDVKNRAIKLMHEEGLGPDDAIDHALRQLDHEDAVSSAARAAAEPGGFPGDTPMGAKPAAPAQPVTLKTMDEARKQLVTMYTDAKTAAINGGNASDMRAMAKILHEFDNSISDALASGKFSGDAALAKQLQDEARASHAEYKRLFSSRGAGDEIGRAVEKILGRYVDNAATPEQIMKLGYGPANRPGTGDSVKVAMRLREVVGPDSREWAQWKQGLFHYVDDTALSPAKRADRIEQFLGSSMARSDILSAAETRRLESYARNLRATEPNAKPLSRLEKNIARIDGTDGAAPATVDDVAKMITAGTGDAQHLLGYLENKLTKEGWGKVKQAVFDDLINAPAGHNEFTALQKSKRLSDYLGSAVSKVVNTPAERAEMAKLASIYKRMVPLPGTTNPSGSATLGAKIARKALDNVGAMIGLGTGGVPGAIVGHALQRGGEVVRDAKAGKEAIRLFFGKQQRAPIKMSRVPMAIAAGVPASQR